MSDDHEIETALRNRLDDVAAGHTPHPDWGEVAQRSKTLTTTTSTPSVSVARRRGTARAAVAAAVVLIAGGIGFIATRDEGPGEQVKSGPAPGDRRGAGGPTGWWIPEDLPPGWTVESVSVAADPEHTPADRCDQDAYREGHLCRQETVRWIAADGQGRVEVRRVETPGGKGPSPIHSGADPGPQTLVDEIDGWRINGGDSVLLGWYTDDTTLTVSAAGVDQSGIDAIVRHLDAAPLAEAATPPPGWAEVMRSDNRAEVDADAERAVRVFIDLRHGNVRVPVVLSPTIIQQWDFQPDATSWAPIDIAGAHGTGTMRRFVNTDPAGPTLARFEATWVDTTIQVGSSLDEGNETPEADVSTAVRALRPASAAEWATFVGGVPHTPAIVTDALTDLLALDPAALDEPLDRPDGTKVEEPAATTPGTDACTSGADTCGTTDDLPDASGYLSGPPGSQHELPFDLPDAMRTNFDDLTGLVFELKVARRSVVSGSSLPIALMVHNMSAEPRTIHECSARFLRIGFIPATTPDAALPYVQMTDCFSNQPSITIPANGTARWPLPAGVETDDLVAREPGDDLGRLGGTLAPGEYLAVVDVVGPDSIVRASYPVTVTPHPCGGFDAALARRYERIALYEAELNAKEDDRPFRVVRRDGVPQGVREDLRCNRINAVISGNRVLSIDIY